MLQHEYFKINIPISVYHYAIVRYNNTLSISKQERSLAPSWITVNLNIE